MSEPIALCFSGGKDSAIALHEIQRRGEYSVVELITTVTDLSLIHISEPTRPY